VEVDFLSVLPYSKLRLLLVLSSVDVLSAVRAAGAALFPCCCLSLLHSNPVSKRLHWAQFGMSMRGSAYQPISCSTVPNVV
jgi:hypothetical protein